jgi:hypothetical protein
MRKFFISVALITTAAVATPAAAQYQNQHRHSSWPAQQHRNLERQFIRDLDKLVERIDRAQDRRQIAPRTAHQLRRDAAQLRDRFYRASMDRRGLSPREFGDLRQRFDRLDQRFEYARRSWDDRRGRDDRRDWDRRR